MDEHRPYQKCGRGFGIGGVEPAGITLSKLVEDSNLSPGLRLNQSDTSPPQKYVLRFPGLQNP
jgi:hypothetical protein